MSYLLRSAGLFFSLVHGFNLHRVAVASFRLHASEVLTRPFTSLLSFLQSMIVVHHLECVLYPCASSRTRPLGEARKPLVGIHPLAVVLVRRRILCRGPSCLLDTVVTGHECMVSYGLVPKHQCPRHGRCVWCSWRSYPE